jgi:hypothetical protein
VIKCPEHFEVIIIHQVRNVGHVFNCHFEICYVRVFTYSQWVLVQLWSLGFVHHVGKVCEILGLTLQCCQRCKFVGVSDPTTHHYIREELHLKEVSF